MFLLSPESSNAKLSKNSLTGSGYETSILYLAPSTEADGKTDLCPYASDGCRASCLFTAGRGQMASVVSARIAKTLRFLSDRGAFLADLTLDLEFLVRKQTRTSVRQAVRLNGTSDVSWEAIPVVRAGVAYPGVPQAFPELQFYDYTKSPVRAASSLQPDWPSNYQLTFSRSEVNGVMAARLARRGVNVAVVFADTLPDTWEGRPVIDGTLHDQRFLDPKGVVVGLVAKGKARKDDTGFVVGGAA